LPHDVNGLIKSTVLKLLAKNAQIIRPLDGSRLKLYRTRCQVKIDKARRLLGYEPAFSFERGIDLTGQFLEWAGLVSASKDILAARRGTSASRLNGAKEVESLVGNPAVVGQ
jgi:hypothetical protein